MLLLSNEASNAKLAKNATTNSGYETSILYLAPATEAGGPNLCPASTPGCRSSCLYAAGRGRMSNVIEARINKAKRFINEQASFLFDLCQDLEFLVRKQARTGVKQAVRLNGTSDISWESLPVVRNGQVFQGVPQAYPELQFYDYTKVAVRAARSVQPGWPTNYRITFSRSESNQVAAARLAKLGVNVAVVWRDTLPAQWQGQPVIDGTSHDQRFLDPQGVIVGLIAKGPAKKDESGFVLNK